MARHVVGVTRSLGFLGAGFAVAVVFATGMSGGSDQPVVLQPGQEQGGGAGEQPGASAQQSAADPSQQCIIPAGGGGNAGLSAEQADVAKKIIGAAQKAGVGEAGARIGVATSLVETNLRNLDHGHASSIGAFQELAGGGSGFQLTNAQRMDPAGAAGRFYTKLKRHNWKSMDPGDAAQKVQVSAHPERYAQRMGEAAKIVASLGGGATGCKPSTVPGQCPATNSPAESGLQPGALRGLRCGAKAFPKIKAFGGRSGRPNKSDHPMGRAVDFMVPGWKDTAGNQYGWQLAKWAQTNHAQLNVKYVIFDDKIWRPGSREKGWKAYTHPNGATSDPTLRHLDHVHVSFKG